MDKKELNIASDRVSFLYIEKMKLKENEFTVQAIQANRIIEIPISTIACIILGPGTSITHGAVKMLSECGCSMLWMGSNMQYMYCYAEPGTRNGKNILIQARYQQNKTMHMSVVRKMNELRYPGRTLQNYSLQQLRGLEGKRMKALYSRLSAEHNVCWNGRNYDVDNFDLQDDINKCITWCNQFLYAIVKSVVLYLGFSNTLGFVHTGHIDAFVFDIADLYKEDISIPCAFEVASSSCFDLFIECRIRMHMYITKKRLMSKIPKDIKNIFTDAENISSELGLWNIDNVIESGKNYS